MENLPSTRNHGALHARRIASDAPCPGSSHFPIGNGIPHTKNADLSLSNVALYRKTGAARIGNGKMEGRDDDMDMGNAVPHMRNSDLYIGNDVNYVGNGDLYIGNDENYVGNGDLYIGNDDPESASGDQKARQDIQNQGQAQFYRKTAPRHPAMRLTAGQTSPAHPKLPPTPGLTWNGTLNLHPPSAMPKITLNLASLTDDQIFTLADEISAGLTANAADFPGATPTAAQIAAARTAASASLADAKLKTAAAKAAFDNKDNLVTTLKTVLTKIASWTEDNVADPVKIQKIFALKKPPAPAGSLGQVQGLAITFGDNPGELDFIWQPEAKAQSYEMQIRYPAQAGSTFAHIKTVGKSRITLTGLQSAQAAQFRVRATGAKGAEGPWSDLAEHLVP